MNPEQLAYFSVLFLLAFLWWMERDERKDFERDYWKLWHERNGIWDKWFKVASKLKKIKDAKKRPNNGHKGDNKAVDTA